MVRKENEIFDEQFIVIIIHTFSTSTAEGSALIWVTKGVQR